MTFQKAKALQSLTALNFSSIYLIAHIWHPLPWTIPPRITAQAPEEKCWPGASLYFQVLFYSHSLASKWVQIDKIESFLLGTELGNQITPAKPGPQVRSPTFNRHAKFQDGNVFLLQFYDTSTAWLSRFMAICIITGLWQMKQIAIKCWENLKSWLCLAY